MAEPNGDYSVRTLADILREHGLESEQGTRPGRRNPPTGRRSNGAHTAPEQPAVRAEPAPERAARPATPATPAKPPIPVPDPPALAQILRDHGLESEYGTRVDRPQPYGRRTEGNGPATGDRRQTGDRRVTDRRGERPAAELFRQRAAANDPGAAAVPAARPEQRPETGGTDAPATDGGRSTGRVGDRVSDTGRVADRPAHPATGRIPAARPASEDEQAGTRAGRASGRAAGEGTGGAAAPAAEPAGSSTVLAWARFVGEMVLALAGGVGVYFAFTLLWQLAPWAAVVVAPLVVTGLVAGAAWWRQRRGEGPLGLRLLAVLLFAGTLLVVAPAAGLIPT